MTTVFKLPQVAKPEEIYNGKFVPPQSDRMLKF
jgi:hypothetical protein